MSINRGVGLRIEDIERPMEIDISAAQLDSAEREIIDTVMTIVDDGVSDDVVMLDRAQKRERENELDSGSRKVRRIEGERVDKRKLLDDDDEKREAKRRGKLRANEERSSSSSTSELLSKKAVVAKLREIKPKIRRVDNGVKLKLFAEVVKSTPPETIERKGLEFARAIVNEEKSVKEAVEEVSAETRQQLEVIEDRIMNSPPPPPPPARENIGGTMTLPSEAELPPQPSLNAEIVGAIGLVLGPLNPFYRRIGRRANYYARRAIRAIYDTVNRGRTIASAVRDFEAQQEQIREVTVHRNRRGRAVYQGLGRPGPTTRSRTRQTQRSPFSSFVRDDMAWDEGTYRHPQLFDLPDPDRAAKRNKKTRRFKP